MRAARPQPASRRCLVAADGWYEWQVTPDGKVPTFIQCVGPGGEIMPFFFAGLWSNWRPKDQPNAAWLETFTILTHEACPDLVQMAHDRMPVVLPESAYSDWLDRTMTSWGRCNRGSICGGRGGLPPPSSLYAGKHSEE